MLLYNQLSKDQLKVQLMTEDFRRTTLSFYRYVRIQDPRLLRDQFYQMWSAHKVLGRIYLAKEGINAQLSVPEIYFAAFKQQLYLDKRFTDTPFKIAIEQREPAFYKLTIKVRPKIVADGLPDDLLDLNKAGKHLSASEFNAAMDDPRAVIVDMRNRYESEVGHFEGAITPSAETFREELPFVLRLLKGQENKKVLLYCTGGIRCEKASMYLKHHGFKDVNQLAGGIIEYTHQVKRQKLPCRFKGKNFVFDERLGERVTEDVLSRCYQCGKASDQHLNCAYLPCNALIIQCSACLKKSHACCSLLCQERLDG